MAVQFRNKGDTRRYAAAEDAFTSEGGYLAQESDEALETDSGTRSGAPHPSRDFGAAVHRYSAGVEAVLAVFRRGGSLLALRSANHSDR